MGDRHGAELGQWDLGAAVVASLGRGPLGRLGVDGDKGDVIGKVVSVRRGDVWSMNSEFGHGTGEELTGAVSVLATRVLLKTTLSPAMLSSLLYEL